MRSRRVFQSLANRKPDLDAGVFAYAKAGFGNYLGFLSALGYWAGTCIGNVSYFVLIMSTLGLIKYTILGRTYVIVGDRWTSAARSNCSAPATPSSPFSSHPTILWSVHFLVLRGIKQAAAINTIATVAKIIPIALFLVFVAFGVKSDLFAANLAGGADFSLRGTMDQVRATMAVTLFVFLGVEGASVYSRYAATVPMSGTATISASSACCA